MNFTDASGLGTITNDDAATVSINNVTADEGNSGNTTFASFTVTLSNPSDANVTFNCHRQGTATSADNDYTAITSTVMTFAPRFI